MPTKYQGTAEERLALDTFIKLTRAVISFEARMLSYGTLEGITLSQFGALEALYHLGPLSQGTLSQKMLKSTGNMTLIIDNLEKQSLVRRVRSLEDRRIIKIELTDAGRILIEKLLPNHVAAIVQEMSVLSPDEQRELSRLARKLGQVEKCATVLAEAAKKIDEEAAASCEGAAAMPADVLPGAAGT